jgi:hypothetical protein
MKNSKKELKQRLKTYGKAAGAVVVLGTAGAVEAEAQIDYNDFTDIYMDTQGSLTAIKMGNTGPTVFDIIISGTMANSMGFINEQNSMQFIRLGASTFKAKGLDAGSVIGSSQSFAFTPYGGEMGYFMGGDFQGAGDKYIGVSFDVSGTTHYGWILVNVGGGMADIYIKATAWNKTAGQSIEAGQTVLPAMPGLWTGATDTDWNTGSNWDDGNVPDATVDVEIPSVASNQPAIDLADNAVCKDITIESGAYLTLNGAGKLEVVGDWDNQGTFTPNSGVVEFIGTATQAIGGATTFYDLKINNTHVSAKVDASGATSCNVSNNLTISDGIFKPKL